MTAPRKLSTIEALETAIERLRVLLVGKRSFDAAEVETAAEAVARAFVHARRHLRILEQVTRDLLAMAQRAAPGIASESKDNGAKQQFPSTVDNEGQRSKP